MNVDIELLKLKEIHGSAVLLREGGNPVIFLPGFRFRAAERDMEMDLLLYPSARDGYPTRLFFEKKIDERAQNWNSYSIIDRQWWSPSWKDVGSELSWPIMLCAHLRAVA
jgi:hypothetical protein